MIGILGGTGPEATLDMQYKLFQSMKRYIVPAKDQDYIRVICDNNPQLPNRDTEFYLKSDHLLRSYLEGAQFLEVAGCRVLILPCNSAHIYRKEIQSKTLMHLVDIIEKTAQYLTKVNLKKPIVGVLCSETTRKGRLYSTALEKQGVSCVYPPSSYQSQVSEAIYMIKADNFTNPTIKAAERLLSPALDYFKSRSVEAVVLGCTELPLLINRGSIFNDLFCIDPTLIGAEYAVKLCLNLEKN